MAPVDAPANLAYKAARKIEENCADEVKDNARKMLLAGAVGFNIEDGQPDGSLALLEFQLATACRRD